MLIHRKRKLPLYLEFCAVVGATTVLLGAIYQWLFYPTDTAFPYPTMTLYLLVALVANAALWVPVLPRHPRPWLRGTGVVLLSVTALLCLSLAGWSFALVRALPEAPVQSLSTALRDATVAMEDGNFYHHPGLDFAAMHRALRANIQAGKIKQGGSTITQQLAKNLFLSSDRTLIRKIPEAFLALALEHRFSKAQILSLYTGTIDYGMSRASSANNDDGNGGQRGIARAACFYFHTTPERLTLAQSAVLVGLVPRPPQRWLSEEQLEVGRETALDRIATFFPSSYTAEQIAAARALPLEKLVFPYLPPAKRGATETIPALFAGVSVYSFADPEHKAPLGRIHPRLKERLGMFLKEARQQFGIVGVEHLGAYVDRGVRGEESVPSGHAYGQAIDISGFRFAGGERLMVIDHNAPANRERLMRLHDLLTKHFDRVLYWENEPKLHQNHFHAEVIAKRCLP